MLPPDLGHSKPCEILGAAENLAESNSLLFIGHQTSVDGLFEKF
jgi:hypothetical protein